MPIALSCRHNTRGHLQHDLHVSVPSQVAVRKLFDSFHYPPAPNVKKINGFEALEENEPVIKKVKIGANSLLSSPICKDAKVYEQAMRRLILLYKETDASKETKINRYQITQKYSFKVEVASFFGGQVLQFPYDQHKIALQFQLEPISVRKWILPTKTCPLTPGCSDTLNMSNQPLYQLNMPLVFGKNFQKPCSLDKEMEKISREQGLDVGKKENAYYMVRVKPFPTGAHLMARELINDFDIKPFSLEVKATELLRDGPTKNWDENDPRHLRMEKHFETSCVVTFDLVRHIIAPMLSVLLPLWVIQLMLPFTWLMEISPVNDAFSYLVGLLLTVISHRGVMEEKMQFVQRITDPDIEFIKTITFLFLQMLLVSFFNGVAEDFYVVTFVSSDYFMFNDGLNVGFLIFVVQLLYLTLRILRQLIRARHNSHLVSKFGDIALFDIEYNKDEPISLQKYAECVLLKSAVQEMVRKELLLAIEHMQNTHIFESLESKAKTIEIDRKTYFSYNVKLYSKGSLPSDLFRMRLQDTAAQDQSWDMILDEGEGNIGAVAYTKQLADIKNEKAYGQKVVYDVIPNREGSTSVQLEVQFIKPDATQTQEKAHSNFKSNKLKKSGNRMPPAPLLFWLLLKSIWFEARHGLFSKGSFVKICADIKLFRIAVQVNQGLKSKGEPRTDSSTKKQTRSTCSVTPVDDQSLTA